MVAGRALHFVFKIPDRGLTAKFYREILGMKVIIDFFFFLVCHAINLLDYVSLQVLRHEEFSDGCEAACNG